MPAGKASSAPAPSSRSRSVKARAIGQAELQRERGEFRNALKITKRAISKGLAKLRKAG